MKLLIPYKSISVTFYYLIKQIEDSIPFAENWINENSITSPEDLFFRLKENVIYKNDKGGIEQLQTMQTLFGSNNIHGIPGAGDCDCFTITSTACSLVLGYKTKIVLVGRNEKDPVHIYNIIGGKYFDLTQPRFDSRRIYPFKQIVPIKFK